MPPSAIMKKVAAIYRRCGYIVDVHGKDVDRDTGETVYALWIKRSRKDEDMPPQTIGRVLMIPFRGDARFEFEGSEASELRNVLTSLGLAR